MHSPSAISRARKGILSRLLFQTATCGQLRFRIPSLDDNEFDMRPLLERVAVVPRNSVVRTGRRNFSRKLITDHRLRRKLSWPGSLSNENKQHSCVSSVIELVSFATVA